MSDLRTRRANGKLASRSGMRKRVFMQRLAAGAGWQCSYCGIALTPIADAREPLRQDDPRLPTIDHVEPRSRGGRNVLANMVLSCAPCNSEKSDRVGFERPRPANGASAVGNDAGRRGQIIPAGGGE